MKIVIREGCTAYNTTIDGVSISDLPKKYIEDVLLDKVLAELKKRVLQNNIDINSLIQVIEYDNYESSEEPCDQCGDHVTTTTWNI
jgi:hypothetical protein